LARAYESKLFKEFALVSLSMSSSCYAGVASRASANSSQIDLKHYKSKRLALRWRTGPEVVDGIGEDTCGSLRCKHHTPRHSLAESASDLEEYERRGRRDRERRKKLQLRSFELPFAYEEAGERKEALVKVRLCKRCERKLVWKSGKEEVEDDSDGEAGPETARGGKGRRAERESRRGERHRNEARDRSDSPHSRDDRRHRHRLSSRRDDEDYHPEGHGERYDRDESRSA
jgi:protein FRA10AC1